MQLLPCKHRRQSQLRTHDGESSLSECEENTSENRELLRMNLHVSCCARQGTTHHGRHTLAQPNDDNPDSLYPFWYPMVQERCISEDGTIAVAMATRTRKCSLRSSIATNTRCDGGVDLLDTRQPHTRVPTNDRVCIEAWVKI